MSSLPVGSFVGNDYVGGAGGPWEDIQGTVNLGDAVASPTYEAYRDTPWKCYFLRNDQADELHYALQMSHSWDRGAVKFHLHVIPMVNPPVGPLKFAVTGYYSWANFGVVTPAAVGWTPFSATHTVGLTDAFKETLVPCFTATPPAGTLESAILLIFLKRDTGNDTYNTAKAGGTGAANVAIISADAHYQKNKDGTSTEIPVL